MKIELSVNGGKVMMNPFVSELLAKVVMAIVSTLKGVEDPKKISIQIKTE